MPAKKRKLWDDSAMLNAIDGVQKGMSVRAASIKFHIPRKTLDDHLKKRVEHGARPGPRTALTKVEEDSLVSYLVYMSQLGFPLTRTMLKAYAWAISKRSGSSSRFNPDLGPGDHWCSNFMSRHSNLSLRKVDSLDRDRAEAFNKNVVDKYFCLLGEKLDELNLKDKPRQIYNCDESFLPLDTTKEKVIALKGSKSVYSQATGTREHITLLCCASAAGLPHPPMIIYANSFPGGQYRFQGPDDALYAKSDSGWVDSELFQTWLTKLFIKHAVSQRPLLLLVDGHKSHVTLDVIDICRENNIVLFCLPPHTTHALQPLDVSVFKALKANYAKTVRALCAKKPTLVISKREFSKVLKVPFEQSFSLVNVKSGFRKCGIYPFDPSAIATEKMTPSLLTSDSSSSSLPSVSLTLSTYSAHSTPTSVHQSPSLPPPLTPSISPATSSGVSCCSSVSPTLFSTPPSTSSSQAACSTPLPSQVPTCSPVNPLVAAGLISEELSDILATPDTVVEKRRSKRIRGCRDLTSDEYRQMLLEDKKRKKEAAEQKEAKKAEREKKKAEREKKKAETKQKTTKKLIGKQKEGQRKKPKFFFEDSDSDSEDTSMATTDPQSSRPLRASNLPSRFRQYSDSESEDDDGVLCGACNSREPEGVRSATIFWTDCNKCGKWYHSKCVFGSNTASKRLICINCTSCLL